MKTNYKRIFAIVKIILGITIPLILLILPSDYFDNGSSKCLSVMLLDVECYGCGMTRAIMHMIHGEFMEAFYFNMASFIVLPLLVYLWVKALGFELTLLKTQNPKLKNTEYLIK
jgi:Protein of unknown function (DUF2752)